MNSFPFSPDEGERYELLERVEELVGYNRDVVVPEEIFERNRGHLHRSSRTYVDRLYPGAKVYRDGRPHCSLHVTDFRGCAEKEGLEAHLEYFNPEHHPVLHLLDVFLWHLKDMPGETGSSDFRVRG